ncbi:hypothetical protein K7X08_007614 [Anisodus acutangulus]|uniref:Uncharacterized protein n=1 Tax=Anisodus acutangulus TaxID=402998 RepID=A0A9Q1R0G4_9SOLA|nr:hypothetical protein K7X08_007614 [Anisodus acutangulus]
MEMTLLLCGLQNVDMDRDAHIKSTSSEIGMTNDCGSSFFPIIILNPQPYIVIPAAILWPSCSAFHHRRRPSSSLVNQGNITGRHNEIGKMLVLFLNYISRPWYSICSKRCKDLSVL